MGFPACRKEISQKSGSCVYRHGFIVFSKCLHTMLEGERECVWEKAGVVAKVVKVVVVVVLVDRLTYGV